MFPLYIIINNILSVRSDMSTTVRRGDSSVYTNVSLVSWSVSTPYLHLTVTGCKYVVKTSLYSIHGATCFK